VIFQAPTARPIPAQGVALGLEASQPRGLKARSNILTMPQSLSLVIIHIIFSTKDLKPVPTMSISHRRMHPYVARTGSTCDLEELIPGFPQKYVKNGSKAKECRK
jgi:hypothetical protein